MNDMNNNKIKAGKCYSSDYSFWYDNNIEPEVRELVKTLRDRGINTTCSCGHDMYIEFITSDPTTDMMIIRGILIEKGIKNWFVEVRDESIGGQIYYGRGEIKMKDQNKQENEALKTELHQKNYSVGEIRKNYEQSSSELQQENGSFEKWKKWWKENAFNPELSTSIDLNWKEKCKQAYNAGKQEGKKDSRANVISEVRKYIVTHEMSIPLKDRGIIVTEVKDLLSKLDSMEGK